MTFTVNYEKLAAGLFGGKISDLAKKHIEILINHQVVQGNYTKQNLAYLLATVYHETGIIVRVGGKKIMKRDMAPVQEMDRGGTRPYAKPGTNGKIFFGRGQIQLTWEDNYKKAGKFLGIDLWNNPDLALDDKVSADIAVNGMLYGWFTGKNLRSFQGTKKKDGTDGYYYFSRRIINSLDKADLIEGYAIVFERCIN